MPTQLTVTRLDSVTTEFRVQAKGHQPERLLISGCFLQLVSVALFWAGRVNFSVQVLGIVAGALLQAIWAGAVRHESVTVLRNLGVLLECQRCWAWKTSRFLDCQSIQAVIINEGVSSTCVEFYLAFILHGFDSLAVGYGSLMPRLAILQEVYRGVHDMLQPEGGRA